MTEIIRIKLSDALNGSTNIFPADATVVVDASGDALQNLTAGQIAELVRIHVDVIDAGTNFEWSWAQASELLKTTIIFNPNGFGGVLRDTAAQISQLTPAQITAIGAKNFRLLDTGGTGPIVFSIDQYKASTNLNSLNDGLAPGNVLTLRDTSDNLKALTLTELGLLSAHHVSVIDASDNKLDLTPEKLDKLDRAIQFAAEDDVSLTGSAHDLAGFSADLLLDYAKRGIDSLHATDAVSLTVAQAANLASSGLHYVGDNSVTVTGTIGSFTAGQLAALGSAGVDVLDADSDTVLTYAKAVALSQTGLVFAGEDKVTVADTGRNIALLTSEQLARLAHSGVDVLDSTTNAIVLTSDQLAALGSMHFASGDTVTISTTGTSKGNSLVGSQYDDVIKGFGGDDRLTGGAGNDRLAGGSGVDVLTGGSGSDVFVFDTKPGAQSKADRITDFDYRKDSVYLESSIFTKLGKNDSGQPVHIKASFFKAAAAAADGNDYLLFNTKTHVLSYDQDGSGKVYKPIPIAVFQSSAHLTAADIFLI